MAFPGSLQPPQQNQQRAQTIPGEYPQNTNQREPASTPNPATGQQTPQPAQQAPQFHIHFTFFSTQDQTQPSFFFPFFFDPNTVFTNTPSFQGQPPASQKAMNSLPKVTITQRHVDAKSACVICQDSFKIATESDPESNIVVRQMPCGHLFCEDCLFEWLKQSNTCPTCRYEILTDNQEYNIGVRRRMEERDAKSSTVKTAHMTDSNHAMASDGQCDLAAVGCCDREFDTEDVTEAKIVHLPHCHHQFHASCLRTSLRIEGYDLDKEADFVDLRCPTCRTSGLLPKSQLLELPSQLPLANDSIQNGSDTIPMDLDLD